MGSKLHRLFYAGVDIPHQLAAAAHRRHGVLNALLGLLRGLIRLGSEVAHLVGHHGKALAGHARTRGLDGGVESKDIRLECNVFDRLDDLFGIQLAVIDIFHRLMHFMHMLVGNLNLSGSHIGLCLCVSRRVRVRLGGRLDLVDGSGQFLHGAGLLCRTLRQRLRADGYLIRSCGHLIGGALDLGHGAVQIIKQIVQVLLDGSKLAGILSVDLDRQISCGKTLRHADNVTDNFPNNLLGCTHRVAHNADLILRFKGNLMRQIALAERHDGFLRFVQGLDHRVDQTGTEERVDENHHYYKHRQNDDVSPRLASRPCHNGAAGGIHFTCQSISRFYRRVQRRSAFILKQFPGLRDLSFFNIAANRFRLCKPSVHSGSIGLHRCATLPTDRFYCING